jgi:hypothetical protein
MLLGADTQRILEAWHSLHPSQAHPPIYGDGTAALKIAATINGNPQELPVYDAHLQYSALAGRTQQT